MGEYCVTGGNGFIAAYLIKALLQKGHTVRATVRDPGNVEKVGFLWEFEGAKDRLKLMKAELLEDGSFDEAVEGVNGVFHSASPVAAPPYGDDVQLLYCICSGLEKVKRVPLELLHCIRLGLSKVKSFLSTCLSGFLDGCCIAFVWVSQKSKHPIGSLEEKLIDPAIKGTVNVLSSCVKAGVKRVVLTSSSSTTRYRDDVQQISPLNESHWSEVEYCKRYQLWYPYAKTLAEKEAWRIAKESGLDLVVVVPSYVVGPLLSPRPTSSLELLLSLMKGTKGGIPNQIIGFVHIDDVISAHLLAMEESKASGRLICSGPVAHWSEIVELLKAKYPMYPYENQLTSQQGDANPHSNDTSKLIELGLPGFKTIPQMLDDCITSLQVKGFL